MDATGGGPQAPTRDASATGAARHRLPIQSAAVRLDHDGGHELCAVRLRHTVSVPAVDGSLIERARAGDRAAFGELIRPHVASVRRFAYSFARHWSDADDLAQEALLKAYRAFGGFEGRASLATWLYSVTRSVCYDHYRGKLAHSRDVEDPLDEHAEAAPLAPEDGPDRLLEAKDDAALLWRALKTLSAEFRVPLVLFEIEGLSYDEIAHIEGVPVGTIRSRLSRGRQQLGTVLASLEHRPTACVGTGAGVRSSNAGSTRP
jgi:RNA polymerase sigma-70 factor (ECF subfamily)